METKVRLRRATPDERRDHILEVATTAFAEDGYGATSMAAVASRLGGSKATLYKYFASKDELFAAVMHNNCMNFVEPLREITDRESDDPETLLVMFGVRFLTALTRRSALDLNRSVHAECTRFPEVAQMFVDMGPDNVLLALSGALARFAADGRIDCADPRLAAGQYLGMVKGDIHMRMALNLADAPDEIEIDRNVRAAAKIFARGIARS